MLDRAEWVAMFGDDEMFDECDTDGSGKVDEAEWSKVMTPGQFLSIDQQFLSIDRQFLSIDRQFISIDRRMQRPVWSG